MSAKPDTGKPDINKNQVSNQNTHVVCDGEGNQAHRLVLAFHAKRGAPNTSPSAKELAQATRLIAKHGADTAEYIIDYAVSAGASTNFRMRHFGAVLSYVAEALVHFRRQTQRRIREEHKRRASKLESRHASYEKWRAAEVERIRSTLPLETILELQRSVSEQILARSQGKVPPGYETLLRIELMRSIAEAHGVPSFADWSAQSSTGDNSLPLKARLA